MARAGSGDVAVPLPRGVPHGGRDDRDLPRVAITACLRPLVAITENPRFRLRHGPQISRVVPLACAARAIYLRPTIRQSARSLAGRPKCHGYYRPRQPHLEM